MKSSKPQISVAVILVNWNSYEFTSKCLESLGKITKYNVKIYVVDNASNDNSVELLKDKFNKINVISLKENFGFSKANNIGAKSAIDQGATHIWFLNNDTQVNESSLNQLEVLKNDDVGAVGIKIYFAPGYEYHPDKYAKNDLGKVIWYAGGIIDWDNVYAFHKGVDEVDNGQFDKTEETDFITGCSFLVRSEVLEKAGFFDIKYFAYLEDVDLSLRIKKLGLKLIYYPGSTIWHYNASSSGKPGSNIHEYYQTRNRLLVGFSYAGLRTKFALIRESLRFLVVGSKTKRQAVSDAFFGRWGKMI